MKQQQRHTRRWRRRSVGRDWGQEIRNSAAPSIWCPGGPGRACGAGARGEEEQKVGHGVGRRWRDISQKRRKMGQGLEGQRAAPRGAQACPPCVSFLNLRSSCPSAFWWARLLCIPPPHPLRSAQKSAEPVVGPGKGCWFTEAEGLAARRWQSPRPALGMAGILGPRHMGQPRGGRRGRGNPVACGHSGEQGQAPRTRERKTDPAVEEQRVLHEWA